jgi:glycerol-3-phosphate dehydrogenase
MKLDVVIFGGGVAGLWLLDRLIEGGYSVLLLEARSLGAGQTIAAQGIIHGGLKYTLRGRLSPSAKSVRDMPGVWRACLRGDGRPNLRDVPVMAEYCHLWRTEGLRSRIGMIGAKAGLTVKPVRVDRQAWPEILRECTGDVYRLDEQVVDAPGLLRSFARRHERHLLQINADGGVHFDLAEPPHVRAIHIRAPNESASLQLRPRVVVFAAGEGNAGLHQRVGLSADAMQLRPLHMVMLRGRLLPLFGHCVDAASTRATITMACDAAGHTIWHVGGQIAEDGVKMSRNDLIRHARRELKAILPGLDDRGVEWAAYRVNRAEPTAAGKRPSGECAARRGNCITAWPTKLALAPRLAERVAGILEPPSRENRFEPEQLAGWPRPNVAAPPWETQQEWITDP